MSLERRIIKNNNNKIGIPNAINIHESGGIFFITSIQIVLN